MEVLEPEYVERLAEALVETVPGMAERLTGRVLEDLCEEIVRREDSTHSHSIVELITNIQNDWRQEAGPSRTTCRSRPHRPRAQTKG